MFRRLVPRQYKQTTVAEIRGEDHGIRILIRDFPIRVSEDLPERRIEYYPDFNPRFIDAIWNAIGDFDSFIAQALAGGVSLDISVKDAPVFRCEINIDESRTKRQFRGEMPDALIKALASANIRR
jgi:hypothetical protein